MVKKMVCFLVFFINGVFAMNFYPLPKSITDNFRLSPFYSKFNFKSIDLSQDGGDEKKIVEGVGLGIKWGPEFEGAALIIHYFDSMVTIDDVSSQQFDVTKMHINYVKFRLFFPVIKDDFGKISLFGSVGRFFGDYSINQYIEGGASLFYKERSIDGTLLDVGAAFNYELNPDWSIFLLVLYQKSLQESLTNPAGDKVSGTVIDYTGTEMSIGTSIRI